MAKKRERGRARRPATGPGPPAEPAPAAQPQATIVAQELRERLGRLQPREEAARPAQRPQASFLTFWIAGEEYAVPLERAVEIVRCESLTAVPQTPPWLRGVMNVRGSVIPVVDLGPRLGGGAVRLGQRTCALMLETDWSGEAVGMGLLVEAVGRVVSIAPEAIESVPAIGMRMRPDLLSGLIPVDGGFAPVLDADRVLSPGELLPGAESLAVAAVTLVPPTT
jgi:purine-binding chemotaxis protein CheW